MKQILTHPEEKTSNSVNFHEDCRQHMLDNGLGYQSDIISNGNIQRFSLIKITSRKMNGMLPMRAYQYVITRIYVYAMVHGVREITLCIDRGSRIIMALR